MNKLTIAGTILFLLGLIVEIIYSIYPLFSLNEEILLLGLRRGMIWMGLGAIVILVSLIKERIDDNKELKKIKKEDLEP
jgi:hypothetical protein